MSNQEDNYTTNESLTNENLLRISTLENIEQYMSIYGPFTLTTFGIIGNILSILIFLSPRYRRQSSHFYLLTLALSDLCFLIINLIEDTFRNHNEVYKSRINILDRSSPIICILIEYARNTTRLLSSWIIVSFTIERLFVVFYPLKRLMICRRKIARCVVLILFLTSLLTNINVPFHYGITKKSDNNDTICDILPKYRPIYMRYAITSMISVYLVPMCIIGIVNTLICCKLWRKNFLTEQVPYEESHHSTKWSKLCSCLHLSSTPQIQIQHVKNSRGSSSSQYQSVGLLISAETNSSKVHESVLHNDMSSSCRLSPTYSNIPTYHGSNEKQSSQNVKTYIQSRTNRITVTLLLVSCSFLLLNSPYCAMWLVNYIQDFRNSTLKSVKEITELFMLTNFCINFLLYCLSGKIFRTELMYLVRCQWKNLYNKNEKNERLSKNLYRPKTNIQMREVKGKSQPNKYFINVQRNYPSDQS